MTTAATNKRERRNGHAHNRRLKRVSPYKFTYFPIIYNKK